MRVFVTGASGFIGSVVVRNLVESGHEVVGLARSDTSAKKVLSLGASVHRGEVTDVETLRRGAAESDGVIHTAFIHDMSKFKETCEIDRRAIEALGSTLSDSTRRLVVASGMTAIPTGHPSREEDPGISSSHFPRAATEEAFSAVLGMGADACLVRLPPMVHDKTKQGIASALTRVAAQKGISAYVDGGLNRWSAVHMLDAAYLFKLVLEHGEKGSRYHAVGEEGLSAKDVALAIGQRLNVPVRSISAEEAPDHFGWLSRPATANLAASSEATQLNLGWKPRGEGLIADIIAGAPDATRVSA